VTSEIVIDVQPKEVSIAILEDKNLVEFQQESNAVSFSVGDIYLGRVHKLMPGLNAAFVDVGYEKDAFLHYLDLGTQFNSMNAYAKQVIANKNKQHQLSKFHLLPEIPKEGTIADILKPGQDILVQIAKEPISTKGPRLTSEISIAGRFLVLMPFSDKISVSTKIKSAEERLRLKQLLQSITPRNFGVIVRTVAEGKRVAELDTELKVLLKRWDEVLSRLTKAKAPSLIFEETSRTVVILRDILNASFEHIHVNDPQAFEELKDYVQLIMPEKAGIVKLYKDKLPIFDTFNVTRQIKSSFGKTVSFRSGAYLIIEHTEALHVIDVNSGNRSKSDKGQEANALEVNLHAADEVARQLRLRDMGGIIVVDFIDLAEGENRQKVYDRLRERMQNDRAKHNILPLSKFGLMQITRQRVRPEVNIDNVEKCPACKGTGEVTPTILFADELSHTLSYIISTSNLKNITLKLHPITAAYLLHGFPSLRWKWSWKLKCRIRICPDVSYSLLESRFFGKEGEEILN